MVSYTKRRKARLGNDTSIMYSPVENWKYQNATMYNFNVNGMYFESDDALQPDSDILIKVGDFMSTTYGIEGFDICRAKVKWCNKIKEAKTYGVGVEIIGTQIY